MNKLLVVVPYKFWFVQYQHYKKCTRLANSCSRKYILGIVSSIDRTCVSFTSLNVKTRFDSSAVAGSRMAST